MGSTMRSTITPLALTFTSVLCAAAQAQDINRTLDADPNGEVYVSNTAGEVEVTGWSRNEVEVTGELGSGVDELIFERDDDEILIKVQVPRHHSRRIASDLYIKVPSASSLDIHTVSADIEVAEVQGEQELESVSGDIVTEVFTGDVEVASVSGDIEVQGDGKDIRSRLVTVSGDIETEKLAGEIEAESVSGDLLVVAGDFERASAHSVNGEIVFHAMLRNDGRLDIETINGEVDVEFANDVSAKFEIETFNGSINNCFGPEPVRTSEYTPGWELRFSEGGATGRVSIQTLNGDLRLCKD